MSATIECPCCRTLVPMGQHKGLLLNRRASLGSDIITAERLLAGLDPEKDQQALARLTVRLEVLRASLAELPDPWANGARLSDPLP